MPLDNVQTTARTKICKRCRIRTPVENFRTRRHKICTTCEKRQHLEVLHIQAFTLPPDMPRQPGLTSTREGLRKYTRERARAKAPDRKPPLYPAGRKLCRRCQIMKDASEFASWRVRICVKCDGSR